MNSLPLVTFAVDSFEVPSPGQQLLDRFLIGYHSDGQFRVPGCEVVLAGPDSPAVQARVRDYRLRIDPQAVAAAHAIVVVADEARQVEILRLLPSGARCFVHGLLAAAPARTAAERGIAVMSGTATAHAHRLPSQPLAERGLKKCVILTHGPKAAMDALESLRSIAGTRLQRTKVAEVAKGRGVWEAAYSREWGTLFASALSRSSTIQGDPLKDGRTQDIAGLKLVENLVTVPRYWLLDHGDGLQTAIFNVTGACEDLNFAAEMTDGTRRSAQLYRPPAPMSDHYSPFAERIERFFRSDEAPPLDVQVVLARLHAEMV